MRNTKFFPISLLVFVFLTFLVFHKFFLFGLLPIPYNILVGWYFPYNLGGWERFTPGIIFKGGLFAADVFRQMIPWKTLSLELIASGQLPLWNPYNFSGEPLLANPQLFIFHPLSLLYFFLPFNLAWSTTLILQVFLGLICMYLFLRSLSLSRFAAFLGSLAFIFSGHIVSWLEWGIVTNSAIWLPLILFSLNQMTKTHKPGPKVLFIVSIYSTIIGGYPQESTYSLLLSFIYFLFLIHQKSLDPQKTLRVVILFSLTVILTLPQIIPTFILFTHSALKSSVSQALFLRTRLDFRHLMTLFSPDFYGNRITENFWANAFTSVDYTDANLFIGTPALIFVFLSFCIKRKKKIHKLFVFSMMLSLVLSLQSPLTTLISKFPIPILTTGVAAGALFITVFSLSVLSAFGLDAMTKIATKKHLFLLIIFFIFAGFSLFLVPSEFRLTSARNLGLSLIFAVPVLILLGLFSHLPKLNSRLQLVTTQNRKLLISVAIIVIASVEYYRYTQKILSFSPEIYSYPPHPLIEQAQSVAQLDRVTGFWDSEIATNLSTRYHLYSAEGYNPLHSRTYQELFASAETGELPTLLHRSDADFPEGNLDNRNRLLDLTSTKYIVAKVTDPTQTWEIEPLKYPPDRFSLIWQQDKYKIYQNLKSLPRVSLYSRYQSIPDKPTRLRRLFDSSWDYRDSLVLNQDPEPFISPDATGSAKIEKYTAGEISIITNTTGGNLLLLLTDNYYPSWQATLDNQPQPIYIANHTFRAVVVPPGMHTLEFRVFWP